MDSLLRECDFHHFLRCIEWIWSGSFGGEQPGKSHACCAMSLLIMYRIVWWRVSSYLIRLSTQDGLCERVSFCSSTRLIYSNKSLVDHRLRVTFRITRVAMIWIEPRSIYFGDSIKLIELIWIYIHSKFHSKSSSGVHTSNNSSLTQATDTSNIRLVFAAVKETILQNALKDSGIL